MKNIILLFPIFLTGFYSKVNFKILDSVPVKIKGEIFYLKDKMDKATPYYYIFSSADKNEVYDIRNKKILWTRQIAERKSQYKKLPKERKFKEYYNGKVFYKYFKDDSLHCVDDVTFINDKKKIKKKCSFISYDSLSNPYMWYGINDGKINCQKGYINRLGAFSIPYSEFKENDWEEIPKKSTTELGEIIHNHDIIFPTVYEVPDQEYTLSGVDNYYKLPKIESSSKKYPYVTFMNYKNKYLSIEVFYNDHSKKLLIKKTNKTFIYDKIFILKGYNNIIHTYKPTDFLDVSNLQFGVYFITLRNKNTNVVTFEFEIPKVREFP